MTVPCVPLQFRDDVLPFAFSSLFTHILSDHLYGSLFQIYSSIRSPPLSPVPEMVCISLLLLDAK